MKIVKKRLRTIMDIPFILPIDMIPIIQLPIKLRSMFTIDSSETISLTQQSSNSRILY